VSWQVVRPRLCNISAVPTVPARNGRCRRLMGMVKFDIAGLKRAYEGKVGRVIHRLQREGNDAITAGDGENGFLDLSHGVMADLLEIDMRHVRHLVGDDHGVDDGRAVDGERFAQRGFQLTRLARRKSVPAAGAGQCREVRIWKFDGFAETAPAQRSRLPA